MERRWQHNTHTSASSSTNAMSTPYILADCESLTPTQGATQKGVDCESLTPTRGATQQSVDCESLTPTQGATQQSVDCESLTPTQGATQQSVDCESLTPTRGAMQKSVDCESLTPTRGAMQQSVDSKIVPVSSIAPEGWGPKEGGNATSPLHSRGSPTKGTKSEVKTYARGHHDAPRNKARIQRLSQFPQ